MKWLTSLFYGVNWCQFYPNQWILVHFHGSFIFVNVDITGFVRVKNSLFSIAKFSEALVTEPVLLLDDPEELPPLDDE